MTCPGMCGSGVRIGMTRTITKTALNIIPEVLEMESCGCFGVAPGSVVRASCVRRAASGPTPRPGASTSASAYALLHGSYLLSSDFLFFEFYGRSKYKNESAQPTKKASFGLSPKLILRHRITSGPSKRPWEGWGRLIV